MLLVGHRLKLHTAVSKLDVASGVEAEKILYAPLPLIRKQEGDLPGGSATFL